MQISVVVPVKNEAGNVAPLLAEIRAALDGVATYEAIFVDDGSKDATAAELTGSPDAPAAGDFAGLRVLRHDRSYGQSAALVTGVRAAGGEWIATLDGDGQNDPADLPKLWAQAAALAADDPITLIGGERVKRQDSALKRASSRIANRVRGALLRDDTRDTGCGLKLFRRAAFLNLPAFNHMHRFLAALVRRDGGAVVSVPVNHRPRGHGRSKYGVMNRLWVGIVDLFGMMWLQSRACAPQLRADD
ncbi:MAG: glycosyltransferase family 2 protein [Pseudomonadota bacterium]